MKKPKKRSPFEDLTMSYSDLAAYLKSSRWNIYAKVKDGTIPVFLQIGRKTIFLKDDIDRLFKIPETGSTLNKKG